MSRYPRVYAKVGTVPYMVWLRSKKPPTVGQKIEYRLFEPIRGVKEWSVGMVTCAVPLKFNQWA